MKTNLFKSNLTKVPLTFAVLLVSGSAYSANYGRIQDPQDPANAAAAKSRCGNVGLSQEKCTAMRTNAVGSGCISADEARQLETWGLAPVCFDVFTGPEQYHGWCTCGCFHPLTEIDVEAFSHLPAQVIAENPKSFHLKHLSDQDRFALSVETAEILYVSSGPESRPLVVIETQDGRSLKVTSQHAVLTASGEMIQAQNVRPETLLRDRNGDIVALKSIRTENFSGNVLNFRLDVEKPLEHVIFAEGLAVGDQAWQSSLEDLQNQVLLRMAD